MVSRQLLTVTNIVQGQIDHPSNQSWACRAGVDADFVITWEMIYGRDPADMNWTKGARPDPAAPLPRPRSPLFLGAEGCVWGTKVWPANLMAVTFPRASVLAERLWLPDEYFGTAPAHNPSNPPVPSWKGAFTKEYMSRLIMWGCQLLRRGVGSTPIDNRDHFPRRSLWQQCEVDLPDGVVVV